MKKNTLRIRLRTSLAIFISLIMLFGISLPAIASNPKAIMTTIASGDSVNENQYDSKQEVYIHFGSKLPEGTWTVVVSQPGVEEALGTGTQEVSLGERIHQLWDITNFSDSTSGGYKVEAIFTEVNNGGEDTTIRKSDNFKVNAESDDQNPDGEDPDGEDPDGEDPDGEDPDGEDPDGEDPDGEDPDGEDPDGEDPDGEDPDGEDPDGNEDDDTEKVDRPRRNRHPRADKVVVAEVPEEEVSMAIPEAVTEEVVPTTVTEEVPLALPYTGATSEGLIGLSMLLSSAGIHITRKKF